MGLPMYLAFGDRAAELPNIKVTKIVMQSRPPDF